MDVMHCLKYCPSCGGSLKSIQLIDILQMGVGCDKSHRFSIVSRPVPGDMSAKASSLSPPNSTDSIHIIQNWLSIPQLRSHLNDQLAGLLRRIYEIEILRWNTAVDNIQFTFCIKCMAALAPFDHDDAWVIGLRCQNGHSFTKRHGIRLQLGHKPIDIMDEMPNDTVRLMVKRWINHKEKEMTRQIHPQIHLVFTHFIGGF